MGERFASGQTRHDRKVRDLADRLSGAGYMVRADISGYPRPDAIRSSDGSGSRRPDIVIMIGGVRTIIEVETGDSRDRDRAQQRVFRDYARRHKHTIFRTVRI